MSMQAIQSLNLILRFLVELAALAAMGMWGWSLRGDGLRWLLALGIPVVAMALWVTFAVPDDPSRSGHAPVPTPGALRLLYEAIFFGLAAWSLYRVQGPSWGWTFGAIVVIHYAVAYERIIWLLKQ